MPSGSAKSLTAEHVPEDLLEVPFHGPDDALDGSNRVSSLSACEGPAVSEQHCQRDEGRWRCEPAQ